MHEINADARFGLALSGHSAARLALLILLVSPAAGQSGKLGEKLKQLNVRLQTPHYVLAGTVTDARLNEYGAALDAIHREYAEGFDGLLKPATDAKRIDPGESERTATQDVRPKKPASKPNESPAAATPKPANDNASKATSKHSNPRKASSAPAGNQATGTRSIDDAEARKRFRVIIFANQDEYQDFGHALLNGKTEHTDGMFIARHELLLIVDHNDMQQTYEVLFHEAFHQFMHRHIPTAPVWLNEGLAVHYGHSRPIKGQLVFQRPDTRYWKMARDLIDNQKALPLWDVVSADRDAFYSHASFKLNNTRRVPRGERFYAQAYTLVHALLNDEGGRQRMQNYIRALAGDDGRKLDQITEEYFGPDVCDRIAPYWVRHARSCPDLR